MAAFVNLSGQSFGRLSVIDRHGDKSPVYWNCVCECGGNCRVISRALTRTTNPTRSCGCLARESTLKGSDNPRFTHGHALGGKRSRTLSVWSGMIERCTKASNKAYNHYGGRGITVCRRWYKFENFLLDMGVAPVKMTLDRKNNAKGYSPSNCRWATQKEQMRNTRKNRTIRFQGKTKSLAQWCEELGLNYFTVHSRVTKLNWPIEKALTTLTDKHKRRRHGTVF